MSQKKLTTSQQLDEMREMLSNLQPGKIVTIDCELQERNTTLMLMLYGAVAKYGIGMQSDNAVVVTAQVPVLQVPANHSLQWEVSEDSKSVMLYIVLNENVPVEESTTNASVDMGDIAVGKEGTPSLTPSLAHIPRYDGDGEIVNSPPALTPSPSELEPDINNAIGDEFEDEIEVGLGD